ncbi:twin-arginine translocase subunit TatB [Sulfitobacter mediterraneus]|uniref:Sec-independent protein translocase protein TatB n=1 Tax=Sulfitobacter mediterraneus TaxID=83219 RepID=UPI0019318F2C|nr:Sec-independent protein translocase protein TatB [Sulfitobacter mediterraneus]MBM1632374.1 twin-arginine translocase subunit TatB [Sulfitobacter mediterraneus]MBM1640191.1 twin-arginine translocase subunit TatB [Sulfitobacter mediterraneus]MBM1644239.1 twin-arginine translocase subunit TatB [Sulfitobacter mediterraneus]MBM1648286.1 twin-arginine translocase subunit TatB [Sulfitobacter mediterraneus]MBM1652331.1 twin-arginine translocase subunit TatB [Sulfitobacter mediterraneus]
MFDLGWTELLVVGIVALIVVGPKDLPVLFRRVGQFVGKAKGMAREFSTAMNDAADESGVREMSSSINKSLKAATNPVGAAMDGVKSAASSLTDLDPNSETGKLAAERAADRKKIEAATARAAAERKQREATEALAKAEAAEADVAAPSAEKPATKKPATKKPAAKKPAAKKTAAKKPAAKTAPAKTPAAKKAPAKKSATKTAAAKKE